MAYKIEEINSCTKKICFSFESLDLSKEMDAELSKKRKEVTLKGFRKGKAPMSIVRKIYGPEVESRALDSFASKELMEAMEKEDLQPVGSPVVDNVKYEQQSFQFDAVIEIYPDFEIKDLSKLSFVKDKVEVTEDDLENVIKSYLGPKAETSVIEDENVTLEKGHFAVINFQGIKEDGERPENMGGKDFVLEIGSGQFIPGFEDGMIGMKKSEQKTMDLTFPESYQEESLQNAKVKFEVELLEIKQKKYPELNDELAKEFGHESVEDFKEKNKKRLLAQKEKEASDKLNREIIEKLVEENTIDLPQSMILRQEEMLKKDVTGNLKAQGMNDDMLKEYFDKWKADLRSRAVFQVHSGLILNKLATQYEIEATEADLEDKIKSTAAETGMDEEKIREYYTGSKQTKENILYMIREEKTYAKLVELVDVN